MVIAGTNNAAAAQAKRRGEISLEHEPSGPGGGVVGDVFYREKHSLFKTLYQSLYISEE
jgi:hypothetical protein